MGLEIGTEELGVENFFDVPLVLKDYKDLIPEDYNDREYYEGKPVEGVIFLKQFYKNIWKDSATFEIICYRIPHRGDTMCHLKTFEPIKLSGRSVPKKKQTKQLPNSIILILKTILQEYIRMSLNINLNI